MGLKRLFFSILIGIICYLLIIPNQLYGQQQIADTVFMRQLVDSIKLSTTKNVETYKKALINLQIDNETKAHELKHLGYFFYRKKNYDKCIEYYNEAITIYESIDSKLNLYFTYTQKGNAYLYKSTHLEALDAYYKAQEVNQNYLKNDRYQIILSLNIAIVRRKMGQYKVAKEVYKKALNDIEKSEYKNTITHISILGELSFLYIDLEEYDSVSKYTKKGVFVSELNNLPDEKANFITADGIVLYEDGKYDQALAKLTEAEKLIQNEKTPEKIYLINIAYYIAKCFYEYGEYDKALVKMHEVVGFVNESEYNREAEYLYSFLAQVNKTLGNEGEALKWYEKSIKLDKASDKEQDTTVEAIHTKEKSELDKKIGLLIKYKTRIIAILILCFMVLITVVFIYFKKQRINKLKFEELIKKVDQLKHTKKQSPMVKAIQKINIDNEKIHEVLKKLERLEKSHFFLNIDCNLHTTAKKVKTNTVYLSKIINSYKAKSFNDYINDLRIDYVLQRLKNDKTFRLFSIKSIATEVGYKSDYSFSKHFKAKTGINPSYYIKKIEE